MPKNSQYCLASTNIWDYKSPEHRGNVLLQMDLDSPGSRFETEGLKFSFPSVARDERLVPDIAEWIGIGWFINERALLKLRPLLQDSIHD